MNDVPVYSTPSHVPQASSDSGPIRAEQLVTGGTVQRRMGHSRGLKIASRARIISQPALISVLILISLAARGSGQQPPPPPPGPDFTKIVGPSIEIQKLEPEHPTEGQIQKIYFTLTNWMPTESSGWVAANFAGVPNQNSDTQTRVTDLAPKASVSDAISLMTPHPGESTKIVVVYYDKEFILNRGFRKRLLAQAELDVDIARSYVTKRISGTSYISLSKPDPHDSYSDANGYLLVTHDPGCGIVGNDGTDKFFVNKPLPPGTRIEHVDFRQMWPAERDCDTPWSWLNDAGSYNVRFDATTNSVRWHNSCTGAYNGKNNYYTISFVVSMPTGTDMGETIHDVADSPPLPPSGFSLTERAKPNCSSSTPPPPERPYLVFDGPYTSPNPVQPKMPFTVAYNICNKGTKSSDSFDVALYVDGTSEKDTKTVSKLSPNQCTVVQWNVTRELVGFTHSLELKAGTASLSFSQVALY